MIRPEEFARQIKQITEAVKPNFSFRFGQIPSSYSGGRPTVKFDGETSNSIKTYPYLSSYAPAANDRVLVLFINNSAVILGKII